MTSLRIIIALCLGVLTSFSSLTAQTAYHLRAYKGARLSLTDIIAKKKGDQVSFEFTAINTGRTPLKLLKGKAAGTDLVIDFDNSLDITGSTRLQSTIASAILAGEWAVELEAGSTKKNQTLKVSLGQYPAFEVQPARNPSPPSPQKADSTVVAAQNPSSEKASTTSKSPAAGTGPVSSVTPANKEQTAGEKPPANQKTDLPKNVPATAPSTSQEAGLGKVTDARFADGCADLMVEQIIFKKKTKKTVEISLILLNKGNKKALIYGKDKKSAQRLAIKAQLNATEQLTRGAIVLGGAFIEDGLEKSNGYLLPGHTMEIPLKFSTNGATKFTPYLILSLDVYQLVDECDESNNNESIKIEQ